MSAAQFSTLFVFVIINFLILFAVRTRTTTIISLIIANLVAVLFFSISITNYSSLKEIVLALIIYSMVVLFLISNYNPLTSNKGETNRINIPMRKIFFIPLFTIALLLIFFSLFFVTKNLSQVADNVHNKKFEQQNEALLNQADVDQNTTEKLSPNKNPQVNDTKKARLKNKLSENFLLKRSSDMILLIVAVSASLLILLQRKEN